MASFEETGAVGKEPPDHEGLLICQGRERESFRGLKEESDSWREGLEDGG